MPSIGHIAVGLAAGRGIGNGGWRPMLGCAALAMLPDLDVIAFPLRIPYSAPFGHRGSSHSLAVATVASLVAFLIVSPDASRRVREWLLLFATAASHGLLDTFTDGGLGVALLWPFSNTRYFAPWRPIPVAPIGAGMFSGRGLHVVAIELLIFLPVWIAAFWPRRVRA